MQIPLPVGLAECTVERLEAKKPKLFVDGAGKDHISIRCPDCDMKQARPGPRREIIDVCKPASASDYRACPFFDVDTYDLEREFALIEEPAVRTLPPKTKTT
jgi:hypothetical protein